MPDKEAAATFAASPDAFYEFATAEREWRAEKDQNFDAVCFHARQGIKALLRGVLERHGVKTGPSADLTVLDALLRRFRPQWGCTPEDLNTLDLQVGSYLEIGHFSDRTDACGAMELLGQARTTLLPLLVSSASAKA